MPASAIDDQAEVDSIAGMIADAAPNGENVVLPDVVTTDLVTFTGNTDVTVPIDTDAPVTIESTYSTMDIELPTEIDVSDGVIANDGTVVFEDHGKNAHAAVQTLDDGSVRLQTILESPDASSTYTYTFSEGVELVLLDDGSVEVTETIADGVTSSIGLIDAPWAIDANGTNVPTHYTVDENRLTQHVDHSGNFAYPVTADPKITNTWWNRTVYYNRYETKRIADRAVYGVLGSYLPWVPAKIAAGYLTAVSATFSYYHSNGQCGKLVFYGLGSAPVPQQYGGSEAGGYCR